MRMLKATITLRKLFKKCGKPDTTIKISSKFIELKNGKD